MADELYDTLFWHSYGCSSGWLPLGTEASRTPVSQILPGEQPIETSQLDQQLIGGSGKGLSDQGFGCEVKDTLQQRVDFLAERGLAARRGQRVILTRNLLATLNRRELATVAQNIAAETGLEHRPVADSERVYGIYRRSLMLASGRYAMLDNGKEFSLVPWKPMIEQRLGHMLAATVRGTGVAWEIGRQHGLSIA